MSQERDGFVWDGENGVVERFLSCDGEKLLSPASSGVWTPERSLQVINESYSLVPLTEGDVSLRRMALCHDQVDRTYERFSEEMLSSLAATLPGKSVLAHHDKWSFPLGRFYEASVEPGPNGWNWVMARFYMVNGEANQDLRREIDAGVASYVSVGFRGGKRFCDVCGSKWSYWDGCSHWPGETAETASGPQLVTLTWRDPEKTAEAVEGSLVWLGAQQEARITKAFSVPARPAGKGVDVDLAAELAQAKSRITELEKGSAEAIEARDLWKKQADLASEERSDLAGKCSELSVLAEDGKLYRADLAEEIKRLGGIVEAGTEAAVVAEACAAKGAVALKAARDEYTKRVEAKFPPTPVGEPAPPESGKRNESAPKDAYARPFDLV